MIRPATDSDASRILEIYGQGLETRNATFETEVPEWAVWDAKHHRFCRLIEEVDGAVAGWCAIAPVSARDCYRGVAEVSVYVDTGWLGQGIGGRLLDALVDASEQAGIWTLYSSIFPENEATRRVHVARGFEELGVRRRIAQLDGVWRDTLLLERRSDVVGL
ncbi:MAG: N-acetyltransferase [Chromatiales bacterium]|nr:N-acetyltransferase [Chromatiales bacterium]